MARRALARRHVSGASPVAWVHLLVRRPVHHRVVGRVLRCGELLLVAVALPEEEDYEEDEEAADGAAD